jgi:hypothetical protein
MHDEQIRHFSAIRLAESPKPIRRLNCAAANPRSCPIVRISFTLSAKGSS